MEFNEKCVFKGKKNIIHTQEMFSSINKLKLKEQIRKQTKNSFIFMSFLIPKINEIN